MGKEKTIVIHQPDFLPYLGFFHRFLIADEWIVLDDVQFLNNSKSWHHRDKIKTAQGERWLTVSVAKTGQKTKICDVRLSTDFPWRERHLNLIEAHYRRAPFYSEIRPYLEDLYGSADEKLVDFNMKSILMLARLLDVEIPWVKSSSLGVEGRSNELLARLVKARGGTCYLSGRGALAYFDPEPFEREGIRVIFQEFQPPRYPQLHGDFCPNLSALDVLLNCGIQESRRILRGTLS